MKLIAMSPAAFLGLSHWALDLPVPDASNAMAQRLYHPALDAYSSKYFDIVNGSYVALTVPVDGAHTLNSDYPRVELREVRANATNSSFLRNFDPTSSGIVSHELSLAMAVATIPPKHPQLTVAQVKGDKACLMIELQSGSKGFQLVASNHYFQPKNQLLGVLDSSFSLSTKFNLKLQLQDGMVYIYYNDMTTPRIMAPFKHHQDCNCRNATTNQTLCYFKAGNYLGTNTSYDDADAVGAINLYSIKAWHGNSTKIPPQNATIIKKNTSSSSITLVPVLSALLVLCCLMF
ncbi:hypothetical protein THRCLA_08975 [Thraustotheca clavata]|uniref:Alginate lyase 2 domain-containing protein n=1 Tax=Thraustotheca clavata TaxID=74557 RepID=A0A1V9Z0F4_9STRA|nr:hypothetical protein THRCLA_08975 [Thraustotheca clavata]